MGKNGKKSLKYRISQCDPDCIPEKVARNADVSLTKIWRQRLFLQTLESRPEMFHFILQSLWSQLRIYFSEMDLKIGHCQRWRGFVWRSDFLHLVHKRHWVVLRKLPMKSVKYIYFNISPLPLRINRYMYSQDVFWSIITSKRWLCWKIKAQIWFLAPFKAHQERFGGAETLARKRDFPLVALERFVCFDHFILEKHFGEKNLHGHERPS